MRRNMKRPKRSAPSTPWMKKGSVPKTPTGQRTCTESRFAGRAITVDHSFDRAMVTLPADFEGHCVPWWPHFERRQQRSRCERLVLPHGSTSGTSEQRRCLCIRLPSSLPQSGQRGESVLAARYFCTSPSLPSTRCLSHKYFLAVDANSSRVHDAPVMPPPQEKGSC